MLTSLFLPSPRILQSHIFVLFFPSLSRKRTKLASLTSLYQRNRLAVLKLIRVSVFPERLSKSGIDNAARWQQIERKRTTEVCCAYSLIRGGVNSPPSRNFTVIAFHNVSPCETYFWWSIYIGESNSRELTTTQICSFYWFGGKSKLHEISGYYSSEHKIC